MEGREYYSLISSRISFKSNTRCRLRNSLPLKSLSSVQALTQVLQSQLREKGYLVAFGSRNPKPTADDAYFNVKVDVQKRESIEEAFDTVVHKSGPVNVVIHNGMSPFLLINQRCRLTPSPSCFCHCIT